MFGGCVFVDKKRVGEIGRGMKVKRDEYFLGTKIKKSETDSK